MEITDSCLSLTELKFYAYHGALPQERVVGGCYTVSVRLWFVPAPEALQSDRLEGTLDYAQVYAALQIIMDNPHNLLESLAYDMAHALLVRFPILRQVWLSVRKDTPPVGIACSGAAYELTVCR